MKEGQQSSKIAIITNNQSRSARPLLGGNADTIPKGSSIASTSYKIHLAVD